MSLSIRTLVAGSLFFVAASAVHAQEASPTTVGECRDLTCFGRMAINAKLLTGELKIPLRVYSQQDCQAVSDLVPAAYCTVIEHPRYEPEATAYGAYVTGHHKQFAKWHSLKSWGAMYVGELFYEKQTINAVALADKAECDQINFAMEADGTVPCFRLDSLPKHFTQQEIEDSLRK